MTTATRHTNPGLGKAVSGAGIAFEHRAAVSNPRVARSLACLVNPCLVPYSASTHSFLVDEHRTARPYVHKSLLESLPGASGIHG